MIVPIKCCAKDITKNEGGGGEEVHSEESAKTSSQQEQLFPYFHQQTPTLINILVFVYKLDSFINCLSI